MSEIQKISHTQDAPQDDERDDFMMNTAAISRRTMGLSLALTGAVVAGGAAYAVNQANQRETVSNIATQEQQITPNFLASIESLSKEPAILSSTKFIFITDASGNLFEQALENAKADAEFIEDYQDNKSLIDGTLLASTKGIGMHQEGEAIGVTRLLVDDAGQVAYIAQRVTEASSSYTIDDWVKRIGELPTKFEIPVENTIPVADTIPSPDSH